MKVNNINGVQRFVVVFVTFLGVINVYLMRNTLGLTMTKLNPKKPVKTFSFTFTEKFQWTSKTESFIHASFYIGYVLGHIPGGYLAQKFGGKIVLNVGLFITALLTTVTPFVIQAGGANGLIVMRFMMGLGEAPAFPALGSLLSAWVPPKERGLSSAFVLGGVQMGSLLCSLLTGEVLGSTEGYGTIFFVLGGIGFAWNVLFHFTVSDTPENHRRISDEERDYLAKEIGQLAETKQISNVPWTSLLTSKPVWALIIAQLGHDWALFFMGSYIPKYFKSDILKMAFETAGRFIALAYFIAWIFSIFCGYLGGYLISRKRISITFSRKLFTFISTVIPSAFLVLASYCDYTFAVLFTILSIGTMGAFYAGNRVNVLDICPNYTATLLGLVNGLGAISGIIALFLTGILTPNHTIEEWRNVFWITLAVVDATAVLYLVWASGEIQSWNDNTNEDNWLKRLIARKSSKAETKQPNGSEPNSEPNE